jgi:hypothetical protein
MKLSRRKMARAVLSTAAGAAAAIAAPQQPGSNPEQELQAARARLKSTSDALAGQKLPMNVEPAFQFKA